MYIQNLHTHTTYCDGKDTPEEIVIAALENGFRSIGFSGHSYMIYSDYCGREDKTAAYKEEVTRLKSKYKDKIDIYLGLEVDMYSGADYTGYDYLIGSVHYLRLWGEYVGFDRGEEDVARIINKYFHGDGMAFALRYYEELATLPDYGNFDIIGHFDIITKHLENRSFFDTQSRRYIGAAMETAQALSKKIPFFEVNTGAIARGYRSTPYPSALIIKRFRELGMGAVITSDCHNKAMLRCGMDEAAELLRMCGYKEKYILGKNGFEAVAL